MLPISTSPPLLAGKTTTIMDGPGGGAFHSAWTIERENISARQDAELARLDRRLDLDKANAQATYEHNLTLLDGLPPRQYGEILLCFRDNLQLRQEKAEMQHATVQAAKQEEHKKELQAHFEKFHLAMKRNVSPASATAGIPSPVSVLPASRANSILHTIEVKSPVPETGFSANSIASSVTTAQAMVETAFQVPPAQSPLPGTMCRDFATVVTRNGAGAEQALQTTPTTVPEQTQSFSKRPLEPNDVSQTKMSGGHPQEPPKKKKKKIPAPQDHKPLTDRVKTWEAVSTDAIHFDAIVEYPSDSGLFYVLICQEHGLHFKNKMPIGAAAKHLHSDLHGNMGKHWDLAVRHLGYLVTGCDRDKQTLHNQKVDAEFAAGYIPQNNARFFNASAKLAKAAAAASFNQDIGVIPTTEAAKPQSTTLIPSPLTPGLQPSRPSTAGSQAEKASPGRMTRGIVNPKKFHIYLGKWPGVKGPSFHPVMILGWDSQTGSGLPGTLNDTQLLDQGSDPPGCYEYDAAFEKIIGWAPGYEEGGPKVGSRKFPVLFFDHKRSASWIPAGSLQKYALYDTMTDRKDIKKQQEVREFLASREGFASWVAYQKSCNPNAQEISIQQGLVTQKKDKKTADIDIDNMDLDDYDSSLECETSSDADELKRLLETAGEIPGDDDYSASQETTTGKDDVDLVNSASPKTVYRKSFISTRSSDMEMAANKPSDVKRKLLARRSVSGEKADAKSGIKPRTTTSLKLSEESKPQQDLEQKSSTKLAKAPEQQSQPRQPEIDNNQGIKNNNTVVQSAVVQNKPAEPNPRDHTDQAVQNQGQTANQCGSPNLTTKNVAQISARKSPAQSRPAQSENTDASAAATLNSAARTPTATSYTNARGTDSIRRKEKTASNLQKEPQSSGQPVGPVSSDNVGAIGNVNDPELQTDAKRTLSWNTASEPQKSSGPSMNPILNPAVIVPTPLEITKGPKQAEQLAMAVNSPSVAKPATGQATEVVQGWAVANSDLKGAHVNTNAHTQAPLGSTPFSATSSSTGTPAALPRDSCAATSVQSPIMSSSSAPPVEFSIMSFAQGYTNWKKIVPNDKCIKISSMRSVLKSQTGSPVQITIDPCAMRTFRRHPYGLDNYTMVLVPNASHEPAMHLVFGLDAGARGISGKLQSRKFVRWIQAINPQLVVSE